MCNGLPVTEPDDIYIVGLGMVAQRQITYEVDRALQRCRTIFLLHGDSLVHDYVATRYRAEVEDLGELYVNGADHAAIYQEMAARVLAAAEVSGPVSLATYGHPLVYVAASRQICTDGRGRGLSVHVLPGISALDALLVDLELDPAVEGLQMYEATDLLLRERPLQPDVPLFVWQIGALERFVYETEQTEQQFERFTDYLCGFYPRTHGVIVARTATLPVARSRLIEIQLSELPTLASVIGGADTLFVPPLLLRPIHNDVLLQELRSNTKSVHAS